MLETALGLGLAITNLIATKEAKEYSDKLIAKKSALAAERALGQESDDGRIEQLEQELKILLEGIQTYINTQAVSK
jgi:hypothetical protein